MPDRTVAAKTLQGSVLLLTQTLAHTARGGRSARSAAVAAAPRVRGTLSSCWTSSLHTSAPLSTSSSSSTSTPLSTDRSSHQSSSSGRLARFAKGAFWMSTSAAAGAFTYAKVQDMDPSSLGGFKTLPVGNLQPTIFGTDEPDEPATSAAIAAGDTATAVEEIQRSALLELEMEQLSAVQEYKLKAKNGDWKEANPYWFLTSHTEKHHLTAGTLRGENMLSVRPLKFDRKDKKATVLFMHLGRSLCGHDGIIHGGMLGTILDEATGFIALPNLPLRIGFTAALNINYRKPVKADQFVMVVAEFERLEGRKGYTKAAIYDMEGNVLTEATALYVSPKNAVSMIINYVKNSLGFKSS
ncbi:hypothetical protein DFQ27_009917 [Actinomortierella ambigua]|uniref:Thioesterase domain-containing protein n=1 Tax=Actinomortierella ambigua TaxID=1343610 RepID=A0A9P6PPU4_9FUNG|nr:hypothetical protein DFQ27_009917 [Actinomortierella ambigua]